jgi:hypothetical protein
VKFQRYAFGSIRIDGVIYEDDVVIDAGRVRKRRKKPSKPHRVRYGHTPLSIAEAIPWDCRRLIVGTGALGGLPVMDEVVREARRRGVELALMPTREAIADLRVASPHTNAILHLTC